MMNMEEMMARTGLTRREILARTAALAAVAGVPGAAFAAAKGKARVLIVGAGVGGATCAKYLKLFNPEIDVTVLEQNPNYVRPYGSSEHLTGAVSMADLTVSYDTLKGRVVKVLQEKAVGLDPVKKEVACASGKRYSYDFLVVSPGVELLYDKYEGYSEEIADTKLPSGWIAGPQTALLRKQLLAMPDDGTVVVCAPPNPYRCPPGPYERSALITEWTAKYKPRAKVIIVDPKNDFVTDETALIGWNHLYGFNPPEPYRDKLDKYLVEPKKDCRLSWIRGKDGGATVAVDAKNMTVTTKGAGTIKADVINVIPPMRGGVIAREMGLTDKSGFCPINRMNFESTVHKDVYVLGDSSIADAMPKSAFSANTQAKVCARAIVETVAGRPLPEPAWSNTCYALAGDQWGIFVADVFRIVNGKIARVNTRARYQFFTASQGERMMSSVYLRSWMRTFTADSFL